LEYFETAQTLGFYSLLFLVQALGKQESEQPLEITLVSNNLQDVLGGEVLYPARATALGVGKVAPHEYPHMTFRYIDVVFPETSAQAQGTVLTQLVAELLALPSDSVVAYRGPRRWVPCIEPVSLAAEVDEKQPLVLRQRGVYLITGGLGGIGLSIAFDLARRVKANLVLIGRTALPPRAEWGFNPQQVLGVVATPDKSITDERAWQDLVFPLSESDPIANKIRQVLALEELGSQVLVVKADVTDLAQMQTVVAQVRERFGALHGVIHAAGLSGGGLMQLKTPEVAAKVLAPKVRGTLVLERVLRDMQPDFIVLCSSLYSVLGGIGQVDYCAANAFLDSFAFYNSSQNSTRTISINWDSWQEVGMAVDVLASYEKSSPINLSNRTPQRLQDSIRPQEGVEALRRILSHPVLPQVIVSPRDIQALQTTPLPPLLDLEDGRLAPSSSVLHQRPNLQTAYVSPRNEMEQQIAAIWQKVLGLAQIGVQDNFFAVGGDSLMGLRTMNELRKVFGVDLSINLLFKKQPTVEGMAEIIKQKQIELLGDEQLAEMLKQVSQMSEEEARQLLEQDFVEEEKKG
jgi:NAD(P)-dependent dehydrogenase (short-subunit alcohol dehydrogenase family)/acyl carrier protein